MSRKTEAPKEYYLAEDFQPRTNWFLTGTLALYFAAWAAAIGFVIWLILPAFATCPATTREAIERDCWSRALAVHPDLATQNLMRDRQFQNCMRPALRRANLGE
jgi:hypothetical protein